MKTLEIKVLLRKNVGKKETKILRRQENVPCVMYGGKENLHFYAHENSFRNLIYSHDVHLVIFDIKGKKHKAIVKDIQFHPVTDKILHIDFIEAFDDKSITINIPIELTGNSIGIRNGGKLRQRRRSLAVNGLISDMPDHLEIDITDIDIGESFKVRDLSFDKLEILDPSQVMVVGVVSSRLAAKGMEIDEPAEAEGEDEEGAEGEATTDAEEKSENTEEKSS